MRRQQKSSTPSPSKPEGWYNNIQGRKMFPGRYWSESTVCSTARESRQGWAILPLTSIEACTHTCNISEGNPDAARCLFEVSINEVFVLVPLEQTCNEQL